MKHIVKGNPPSELRRWFDGQPAQEGRRLNCGYADMPGEVKRVVKQHLLEEQGGLCCYTGILLSERRAHIEHFKPQSLCHNQEDVEYTNLLAAYPGDNASKCPYGAHAKANWYDNKLLISPLHGNCENRFRFDQFGRITAASDNDVAAKETIERLCLDHGSLTELRKQAIDTVLFRKGQPLSKAQLYTITQSFCNRNVRQQFPMFCFVIVQAAQALLHQAERERKRKQAIRQRKRK